VSYNNNLDPTPAVGGNITARLSNALPSVVMSVGGLFEIGMPTNTDVQIRALTVRSVYILSEGEYPGGSFSTGTAAPVALTTAFVPADNNVHVAGERNVITIQDILTNRIFRVTAWRFGAIAGNWSGWVEEIGTTTSQVLTPGYGIDINGGVVSQSNRAAKSAPMASAQTGTVVTLGELSFRYSLNATNGNLDLQSATATPIAIRSYGEEFFPGVGATRNMAYATPTVPATGATWAALPVGGLGADEMLNYEIFTATNVYRVRLYSFGVTNIHIIVEKAI
jgi:hypothetical protein